MSKKVENCHPDVSVIVLAYNQERYVSKAIDSILDQETDFSYELILAEDCSQDKTREICIEYRNKYPDNIQLLLHPKNVGMHQNAICAISMAKGKYITFCEGDDYWRDSKKLQKQYEILEKHPEFSGVHTKVDYVDLNGNIVGESSLMPPASDFVSFDYLVQKNVIHTCSFMFRKNILDEKVYSILEVSPAPDYALSLAVALKGDIYYINQKTGAYRKNYGVTSLWKHKEYLKCRLMVYSLIEKYFDIKGHKAAVSAARQFQYFHLFSMPQRGWGNMKRIGYLIPLIWNTVLSFPLKPETRVHQVTVVDIIRVIFNSRFRLKNWRNYLKIEKSNGTL